MKKICPAQTPSGNLNPSLPLPAVNQQAGGHQQGKASDLPGKLTIATGQSAKQQSKGTSGQVLTPCYVQRGQRYTANSQRGRPRYKTRIVQPVQQGKFYVRFDFDPAGSTADNTLSLGFRQGILYHFDGISSADAASFFPARNFSTSFSITDEPSIHKALVFFNAKARHTFLDRAADRTSTFPDAPALVWNPTGKADTDTTWTCDGTGTFSAVVTASNGKAPTGVLTPTLGFATAHTLVSGDAGRFAFTLTPNAHYPPARTALAFAGSTHFNASSWTNGIASIAHTVNVPGPPTWTDHWTLTGNLALVPPASIVAIADTGLTGFVATEPTSGNYVLVATTTGATTALTGYTLYCYSGL